MGLSLKFKFHKICKYLQLAPYNNLILTLHACKIAKYITVGYRHKGEKKNTKREKI